MAIDMDSLGLTDMIRLREQISEILVGRFERTVALAVLRGAPVPEAALAGEGRTLVPFDDQLLVCFATVDDAVSALAELEQRPDAPRVSIAVHWGQILTDGTFVTGDAVTLTERVAATGADDEIRLTRAAYVELSSRFRLRCRPLGPTEIAENKGGRSVELMLLEWRMRADAPMALRVRETGEVMLLPEKAVIVCGRLSDVEGPSSADIRLSLTDRTATHRISRRHFELRRHLDEMYLHPLTDLPTEVDGQPVHKGERARVVPGTTVRLSGVMSVSFLADDNRGGADETVLQTIAVPTLPKD